MRGAKKSEEHRRRQTNRQTDRHQTVALSFLALDASSTVCIACLMGALSHLIFEAGVVGGSTHPHCATCSSPSTLIVDYCVCVRRGLKAGFMLVPLFGLQLLLTIYRPDVAVHGARHYEYISIAVTNSQAKYTHRIIPNSF